MVELKKLLTSYRDEFVEGAESLSPLFPFSVKIKLTGRCNLRCPFCNYWKLNCKDTLDLKTLKRVFNSLKNLKTEKVHFSGGEILLREDIVEILSEAHKLGFKVNITTNGTLIDMEMALNLVELVNSISISIDSPLVKVHDKLRGKGNFKNTLKGIKNLLKAKKIKKSHFKLRINTLITKKNYKSLKGMADFVREIGGDRLLLIPVDDFSEEFRLSKRKIFEFYSSIFPYCREKMVEYNLFDNPLRLYPFGVKRGDVEFAKNGDYSYGYYKKNLCYAPILHTFINWDGLVYPCCNLRGRVKPLGSVFEEDLENIWRGKRYELFRREMLEKRDLCMKCDDFLYENRILNDFLSGRRNVQ